jgi:hypothetical protein
VNPFTSRERLACLDWRVFSQVKRAARDLTRISANCTYTF